MDEYGRPALSDGFGDAADRKAQPVIRLHGQAIPDPYRHLGDLASGETQGWIAAQEQKYQNYTGAGTASRFVQVIRQPVKGIPARAGDHYLFYYKGAGDETARLMMSDTAEGEGRTLIVPPAGAELASVHVSPSGRHIGYRLSRAGKWESELRVMDIETGKDLPDAIPKSGSMWWDRNGKGFTYNHISTDGKGRIVLKHHRLGKDSADDDAVYDNPIPFSSAAPANGSFRNHASYHGPQEWLFTSVGAGDLKPDLLLKDPESGAYRKIFGGEQEHYIPIADRGDGPQRPRIWQPADFANH